MNAPRIALFLPFPEYGHILPTIKLARRLVADGWQVFYVVEAKFFPLLSGNGFHCLEVPTYYSEHPETISIEPAKLTREERAEIDRNWDPVWIHRAAENLVRKLKPAAVFIDLFYGDFSCVPIGENVPTVNYHTCIDAERLDRPPIIRSYGPPRNLIERARLWADWLYHWRILPRRQTTGVMKHRALAAYAVYRERGMPLRPSSMYPFCSDSNTSVFGPGEVSMGHLPADRYFGYGLIDDAAAPFRGEATFPEFASDLPIVYCSFGSMCARYDAALPVFQELVKAFAARNAFNLVVQAGELAEKLSDGGAGNVRIAKFVPQLEYLKRARVAITHGGFGTVKECIANETPMLAIPFFQDQFGNARRLKELGIAESLPCKRFDGAEAHGLVEKLAADAGVKRRLRELYSPEKDRIEFEIAYASLLRRIGIPVAAHA